MIRTILSTIFSALLCTSAWGQTGNPLRQSGNITPHHLPSVVTNGVLGDAGTAANPGSNFISSIGVQASGPGICQYSDAITSPAYLRICLGVTTAGGGQLTLDHFGTASAQPFQFIINGVSTVFAAIIPPFTTNHFACFYDSSGVLYDCGTAQIDNVCTDTGSFPIYLTVNWVCSKDANSPGSWIIVQNPILGAPSIHFGVVEQISADITAEIVPGAAAVGRLSNMNMLYGEHQTGFGGHKSTFYGELKQILGPAAGQRFGLSVNSICAGAGDCQAVSPYMTFYGGIQSFGDEGPNVNAIEYQAPEQNTPGTIQSALVGGGSTTTTQIITGSGTAQAVTVANPTGFTVGEWVVVNGQALHAGVNNTDSVQLTAVGVGSITGIFKISQSSGVTVTPATVLGVTASPVWGQHRYLVNTSQASYSTGTVTWDGSIHFIGSGTTWTNNMVGGDAIRPGCLAPATMSSGSGMKAWYSISVVDSTTQVRTETAIPLGIMPTQNTVTIGGTIFNAADTVALTFTSASAFKGNPVTITYTLGVGETATTVAAGLTALMNSSAGLYRRSIFAKASGAAITVSVGQDITVGATIVITDVVGGTGNETVSYFPIAGTMDGGEAYVISPCAYVLRVIPVGDVNSPTSHQLILETTSFTWAVSDSIEQATGPVINQGFSQRIQHFNYAPFSENWWEILIDNWTPTLPVHQIRGQHSIPGFCPNLGQCDFINGDFHQSPGQLSWAMRTTGTSGAFAITMDNSGTFTVDNIGIFEQALVDRVGIGRGGDIGGNNEFDVIWDNGAVRHILMAANVTDTASTATSDLIDFQVNSVAKFVVSKGGRIGGLGLMIGSLTPLTLSPGEVGLAKITASGTAPGAAGLKFEAVCGTNAGTAKLIAYAGSSTTPATILDNIGAGVSGC